MLTLYCPNQHIYKNTAQCSKAATGLQSDVKACGNTRAL